MLDKLRDLEAVRFEGKSACIYGYISMSRRGDTHIMSQVLPSCLTLSFTLSQSRRLCGSGTLSAGRKSLTGQNVSKPTQGISSETAHNVAQRAGMRTLDSRPGEPLLLDDFLQVAGSPTYKGIVR